MIRAWRIFWIAMWSSLIAFVLTRNLIKYRKENIWWNIGKSLLDTVVVSVSAIFLPPFLIGLNVAWIVGHFENKWIKMVVGITSGILLGLIGTYAMEILIILGVFSVDAKTGPDEGILKRWRQVKVEEQTGEPVAA